MEINKKLLAAERFITATIEELNARGFFTSITGLYQFRVTGIDISKLLLILGYLAKQEHITLHTYTITQNDETTTFQLMEINED